MIRTHEAGTLRTSHAGQQVTLAGWVARRRDHGGVVFIDLRDASGVAQIVIRQDELAHDLRAEFCVRVTGEVRRRPAGNENPDLPTGEVEVAVSELEVLSESDPLPFPVEGAGELSEDVRLRYRYLDIRRSRDGRRAARPVAGRLPGRRRDAGAQVRQRGDPVPDQVHAGRGQGLPGPGPAAARQLVRAAAVAAAVQAAADGVRPGAVLPAGPLLPGRGLPGRPAARVHPDRHRDVLRHPGRRGAGRRGPGGPAVGGDRRLPGAAADPADDLRRRDGQVRLGQARPAVRARADRPDQLLLRLGVPGLPGPLRGRGGDAGRRRADPARAGRLAGVGEVARRPRAGLRPGRRGRRGDRLRAGGQAPDRGRAGRAARGDRRRGRRLRVLRGRDGERRPGPARRGPAGDRPPLRADRRIGVGVHLGGGRAHVRGGRRGRLDRGAPPVHRAAAGVGRTSSRPSRAVRWPTPTTSSATAPRSAAARSGSTAATCSSRCST